MPLTLSATVDGDAVDLAVAGAANAQTNLITNPSFEVNIAGWSGAGGAVLTRVAAEWAGVGGASCQLSGGSGPGWGAYHNPVAVTAGAVYGARALFLATAGGTYSLLVQWLNGSGVEVTPPAEATVTYLENAWKLVSVTGTAPAGAVNARVYCRRVDSSTATFLVDGVLFREVPAGDNFDPADYFDGSSAGAAWTGTAHASASTRDTSVTITREDANAGAGRPVRAPLAGSRPLAGAYAVTDAEAALVGPVVYTVTDVTGATATATVTLGLAGARPRVADVRLPSTALELDAITGYESRAAAGSVVHWPAGRTDPVVVTGPGRRTREGRLTVWCPDYATAGALVQLATPTAPLMLRQPDHPGMDMYFRALDAEPRAEQLLAGGWCWLVELGYVETAPPAAVILE